METQYVVLEVHPATAQNQQGFDYYAVNSKPITKEKAETFKRSLEEAHKGRKYTVMTVEQAMEQKVVLGRAYLVFPENF
jgi:hypothetical protein